MISIETCGKQKPDKGRTHRPHPTFIRGREL